jgi:indolepyruvate ferredoxin oxidoreductase alpha subunit
MTGGQAHPGIGDKLRRSDSGVAVDIETVARGCGVTFVETVDPYDVTAGVDAIKRAWESAKINKSPSLVICRHPCMLLRVPQDSASVKVEESKCVGCRYCIDYFGCPGLSFGEGEKKASVDMRYCVSCGVCSIVCPHGAIVKGEEAR